MYINNNYVYIYTWKIHIQAWVMDGLFTLPLTIPGRSIDGLSDAAMRHGERRCCQHRCCSQRCLVQGGGSWGISPHKLG